MVLINSVKQTKTSDQFPEHFDRNCCFRKVEDPPKKWTSRGSRLQKFVGGDGSQHAIVAFDPLLPSQNQRLMRRVEFRGLHTNLYRVSCPMYFSVVKGLVTSLCHASKLSTSSSVMWICIIKTTGNIEDCCLQLLISHAAEEKVSLKSAVMLN